MGSHCRDPSDPKILDTLPSITIKSDRFLSWISPFEELYQTFENVYCQVSNHTEPSRFKNNSLASLFLLYVAPFLVVKQKIVTFILLSSFTGSVEGQESLEDVLVEVWYIYSVWLWNNVVIYRSWCTSYRDTFSRCSHRHISTSYCSCSSGESSPIHDWLHSFHEEMIAEEGVEWGARHFNLYIEFLFVFSGHVK